MSQHQSNNEIKIIKTQLLPSQWTLWFSYSCDVQSGGVNYSNNLMQVQKVHSWNEFALLWKWASKIQNFFINPDDGSYKKYKFGIQQRKVDSINFFKNDIQPQWQYGQNPKYGYFNFGIDRNNERVNQIFQASVLLGLGQHEDISKSIIGVRIVDLSAKQTHPSRARVEIWVNFRHDNSKQSLQRLLDYQQKLKIYFFDTIYQDIPQIKFFNISTLQGQEVKSPKKDYSKKNQRSYKNNPGYKN